MHDWFCYSEFLCGYKRERSLAKLIRGGDKKKLAAQAAAHLAPQGKLAIIVSPLLSLMADQVTQ